jgi:hypothetical protein
MTEGCLALEPTSRNCWLHRRYTTGCGRVAWVKDHLVVTLLDLPVHAAGAAGLRQASLVQGGPGLPGGVVDK